MNILRSALRLTSVYIHVRMPTMFFTDIRELRSRPSNSAMASKSISRPICICKPNVYCVSESRTQDGTDGLAAVPWTVPRVTQTDYVKSARALTRDMRRALRFFCLFCAHEYTHIMV